MVNRGERERLPQGANHRETEKVDEKKLECKLRFCLLGFRFVESPIAQIEVATQ